MNFKLGALKIIAAFYEVTQTILEYFVMGSITVFADLPFDRFYYPIWKSKPNLTANLKFINCRLHMTTSLENIYIRTLNYRDLANLYNF